MTARQALASAIERRAAEMFEEDGPIGLASWSSLCEELCREYRRLAEVELEEEIREPVN